MHRFAQPRWYQKHPNSIALLLLAPALLYLLAFFVYPVAQIMLRSVFSPGFTTARYARLLTETAYLRIMGSTVRIALLVALFALLLGYPVAYFLTRVRARTAHILLAFVLLPFWTSVLVRTYAWVIILGADGVVNKLLRSLHIIDSPAQLVYNETGVIIGMVHVLLPYMILALMGVMREISPTYLKAAASLGATPVNTFLRVYLPLSMPGVTAGFLLVFILGIGFFITPALLGGGNVEMIALQIDAQINELVDWGFGSALAATLFVVVVALVLLFLRIFDVDAFGIRRGDGPGATEALAPRDGEPLRRDTRTVMLAIITALVLIFLAGPVFLVLPMSVSTTPYLSFPPQGFTLSWYGRYFGDSAWLAATSLSFRVAGLTAVLSVLFGTLAALGLVRGSFRGKSVAYFALLGPLIVPTIVTAVGAYFLFVRARMIGNFWAFVLAHTVLAIPVVVLLVSASLRRVSTTYERAATLLGATPLRALFEVTLPIIRPSLIAAALFAFITSFDEIVVALFVSGTTTATLPRRMWESLRFQIDPTIAAISTLLVLLSLAVLIGTALLRRTADD